MLPVEPRARNARDYFVQPKSACAFRALSPRVPLTIFWVEDRNFQRGPEVHAAQTQSRSGARRPS
jgi:hypothetical protein